MYSGKNNMNKCMRRLLTGAVFTVTALSTATAMAQQAQQQTTTAAPGRVQEQFQFEGVPSRPTPNIEVRELAIQGAPAGAEDVSFRLDNLVIDGAVSYSDAELKSVYEDKLGQTITLAELYGFAAQMTRKYRNDGYILTQIVVPPQTIENGTARLQVVEGYISQVRVEGEASPYAAELINDYASQVRTDGRALSVAELERALLLINDLPGVNARAVLAPSAEVGAADLQIVIERDMVEGIVSVDNFGSRFLGPVQFTGAASLNSALGWNERFTLQTVYAPEDADLGFEMAYVGFEYEQPIFDKGTTISTYYNVAHTDPGYTLSQFDVEGRSENYGVTVSHPFVRSRITNITGRANLDFRDVESSNNFSSTIQDRIRAARVGARFDFLDRIFGVAFNALDVEYSHGLTHFGARTDGAANTTRAAAEPDFSKFTAELQRLQRMTSEVNLLIGLKGQYSNEALYSSEEFGIGGYNFGRGFDSSEIIGDSGFAGKFELQWNEPVNIDLFEDYQVYSFFDAGRVFNEDPVTNSTKTDTLTSAGAGLRLDFTADTQAALAVAFPLNRDVQTQGDKDPKVYVNLSHRF